MPFTEKQLVTPWTGQIRCANGDNINLVTIRGAIQEEANKCGIPVAFSEDLLKVGGLFSSEKESVLIMFNPQHPKDYLRFLIRVQHQGSYAFMQVFNLGGSKNFKDANVAASGSTLKKITNAIGGHSQKLQQEENYYTILHDCVENIFS